MDYRIEGLRLPLDGDEAQLGAMAADALGLDEEEIVQWRILRRAIDARRHRPPAFVYVVALQSVRPVPLRPEEWRKAGMTIIEASVSDEAPAALNPSVFGTRPVVVGCGPAGLFAALTLARHGFPPLLLERGKAVEERSADVAAFWAQGIFDPESSVQFGEGGAGTFSDGKLTSRAKNPLSGWVKGILVEMGASSAILTDAKPHIGTDRLREVLANLRRHLIQLGCEIRFRARMTDLLTTYGGISGLVVNGGEEIRTDCLILACGQSADDTYLLLSTRGVRLEPKPFALGLRIEHPQGLIDAIQYGSWAGHPQLPPAEYVLTAHVEPEDRSVYTFCMCPGGRVIGSSARGGDVITNGMSGSRRDGPYANSAVVVNCRVEDFLDQGGSALSGLRFRRQWEKRAFVLGGGDYRAPAEGLLSFLGDKSSPVVGPASFQPGVRAVSLREVLPPFAVHALKKGFRVFDGKMPGFLTVEANLMGIETRTSSPVRILRGADGQSVSVSGLYPCGEGAGYAGGIVSSALDGIRAALRAMGG